MNVLNLDNKSPSQALLISQLILVIRTVTPTKEQILYCCLILSISALVKINIRLYRQVDFLLNRFTKDRQSFPKNIYMIYMRGSYSILQRQVRRELDPVGNKESSFSRFLQGKSLCFKDQLRLHLFKEHAEMGSRVVKFLIYLIPSGQVTKTSVVFKYQQIFRNKFY